MVFYLSFLGKYFYRNPRLRHLRIEQFNRYCMLMDATSAATANLTAENTIDVDEEDANPYKLVECDHRNYDLQMEKTSAGTQFPSTAPGVAGARCRQDSRLGVSRPPLLEPAGSGREGFYQRPSAAAPPRSSSGAASRAVRCHVAHACLLGGTAAVGNVCSWCSPGGVPGLPSLLMSTARRHCSGHSSGHSRDDIGGARLEPEVMKIATVSETGFSYEERCRQLEITFADPELDVVCVCCASVESSKCDSCRHATGWHRCCANARRQGDLVWRAGSLHAGHLDIQRVLLNLYRRGLPTDALLAKADEYV